MLVIIRTTIVITYGDISIIFLTAPSPGIYVPMVDNKLKTNAPSILNVGFHMVNMTRAIESQPLASTAAFA